MKIAVFMGGSSEEREVSLDSGRAVIEALRTADHEVTPYDVEWFESQTLFRSIETVRGDWTDAVFLALHGGLGENGGVQGILEAAGVAYTGSGIEGSAVAMDKHVSKTLFRHHGIPTADWIVGDVADLASERIGSEIGWPCVVKPSDQGSTIGLTVVHGPGDLDAALKKASAFGSRIMAEAYLPGKELSVPILGEQALPVIEIRPSHEVYDYACKYTAGMSEYFVPAPIPEKLAAETSEIALEAFRILGLRDIARIDFRLDRSGRPVCLEANTLPGMTATSLVPKSAAAHGIGFPKLVSTIAEMASLRKGAR
jgi:D-alanine-D-alanine ligase